MPARSFAPSATLRPPISHSLKPWLTAFAPSTAEAVRSIGGWLFDQVMAGWDVAVVTRDRSDPRPLHILGVRVRNLDDDVPDTPAMGLCLRGAAVQVDLFESEPRIRQMVRAVLGDGGVDVRFWGDRWPDDLCRTGLVSHELSLAARAFKAQAMAAAMTAAGVTPAPGPADLGTPVELFRRAQIRRPSLVGVAHGAG
jgi:hypothetical protein